MNTEQSDTPRTDAADRYFDSEGGMYFSPQGDMASIDFARTLERELNAAKLDLETAIEDSNKGANIICVVQGFLKPRTGELTTDAALRVANACDSWRKVAEELANALNQNEYLSLSIGKPCYHATQQKALSNFNKLKGEMK